MNPYEQQMSENLQKASRYLNTIRKLANANCIRIEVTGCEIHIIHPQNDGTCLVLL